VCPDCDCGFIEEIEHPPRSVHLDPRRHRFPAAAMYMIGHRPASDNAVRPFLRRTRHNGGDRSPFNPVIVLRGSAAATSATSEEESRGFELFYDNGAGSGLRPLPPSMSEFLLGFGFDRLLEQLTQIEINGIGRYEHPPASKAAIDSLPTIEIDNTHLAMESHCAVCKEAFELGTAMREMSCKHIYHPECILPWLASKVFNLG
ncbi:probable E3 ubiquitin-protein ligase RHC2A, partial [Vigna umbellata]|uniref:probable E3 ubiquitin-protein ligase RHC2A n=1 Tax=Vigna umbellata TaxID=87088 RepID=UPI001F5EBA13